MHKEFFISTIFIDLTATVQLKFVSVTDWIGWADQFDIPS